MSKHTNKPWTKRFVGMGGTWNVEDAAGVTLFQVWCPPQNEGEGDPIQYVSMNEAIDCVNALAGRDPAALGELEKACEIVIANESSGQLRRILQAALAAFRAKKEETATRTIPELFERVAGKVPEVRPKTISIYKDLFVMRHTQTGYHWHRETEDPLHGKNAGGFVADDVANLLIEAACVRWLATSSPQHPEIWRENHQSQDRFRVTASHGWDHVDVAAPTLTEALLLAVEQVHGDTQ